MSQSVVRELVTKLRFVYDNSGLAQFQQKVNQTRANLNGFAQHTRSNGRGMFAGMRVGLDGVRAKIRGVTAEWQRQRAVVARAKNIEAIRQAKLKPEASAQGAEAVTGGLLSVKNMALGYIGALAGGSAMQIADEWASVSGRIKLATKDAEEHKYAMEEIYAISQRTGQAMSATGDLFQKVARNQKELGLQTADTLKLTEIIGQTLTIGGGDETANSAGLLQLGQALAAGKLSGDELNSIIEQTPRLAEAIANSFGIGVGQLKEMGKQGKLTAKELAQGLLKQADKIQSEFNEMPKTFSTSMTKLKNAFGRFISYAVNDVLHLGDVFAKMASWVEENIKLVLILATSAIGAKLVLALKAVQGGVRAIGASIWKATAPLLPWVALFATIGLMAEDIYYWINGGGSLIGDLVGDFGEWKQQFVAIGESAETLWFSLKLLFNHLLALTGTDFRPDFDSWKTGAKAALQYVMDSAKRLLNFFRAMVRTVRSLLNGEWAGAWQSAGEALDNFSWLAVLLFYKRFWGLAKIGWNVVRFLIKGWQGFGKVFGWFDVKIGQRFFSIANKAVGAFGFMRQQAVKFVGFFAKYVPVALRFIGNGIAWLSRIFSAFVAGAVRGIFAISRAMLAAVLSNPILAAIAAIIALIALIVIYWDEIKAVAIAAWAAISAKAQEIWAQITTSASEMWNRIITGATEMWDGIKKYASDSWAALSGEVTKLWAGVTDSFSHLWSRAVDNVTGFLSRMIPQGVKDFFNEIVSFFGSDSEKSIKVEVQGNMAALQMPTGNRAYSSVQHNSVVVNAANNPNAVASAVLGAATSFKPSYNLSAQEAR